MRGDSRIRPSHAVALDPPRQALYAAASHRLGRCAPAGATGPGPCRRASPARHRHRGARRRATPGRRVAVLRAGVARGRLSRLGNPAVRHVLAPPGPDLRTAGHAVAHPPAARRRRRARARHHGAGTAGAAELPGGHHVPLQAQAEAGRSGAEGAAHARWIQPREPGGLAGRVRGARRPHRPVPDGVRRALPGGPLRRRGRFDPHVRPGFPAQPVSRAGGAPAARPRVPDGRRVARGLPPALARKARGRPDQGPHLQGHRRRHRDRRHRVLPAAVLRRDRHAVRLPRRRGGAGAARRGRRGARAFLDRHAGAASLPAARSGAAHPAARGAVPAARRFLHGDAAARHAGAARRRPGRLGAPAARRERRPRRHRAARPAAAPPGHHAAPRAAGRRERGPPREPARTAARPPHRRAERGHAGRVRGWRRKGRDHGRAAGGRVPLAGSRTGRSSSSPRRSCSPPRRAPAGGASRNRSATSMR